VVLAARTIDELFADLDEPRCYVARRSMFWAAGPEIGGHAVWGVPNRSDAERYVRELERGVACARTPARLIVDFHQLRALDNAPFQRVVRYFAEHKAAIDWQPVVVPPAVRLGATIVGCFRVFDHAIAGEVPVVSSVEQACEHLGRPDIIPIVRAAYRLRDDQRDHHAAVDRLRELRAGAAPPKTIAAAAAVCDPARPDWRKFVFAAPQRPGVLRPP